VEYFFWIVIVGGILACLVAASLVVFVSNRRALRRGDVPSELPSAEGGVVEAELVGAERGSEAASSTGATDATIVVPARDVPEPTATRMARLRRRLAASANPLARGLLGILSADRLDDATWEAFEDTLISADLGVGPTTELVSALRREMGISGVADPVVAKATLRAELLRLVDPTLDRRLATTGADASPGVVMVVGVNGTGKTTTIGKLARILVAEGKTVVLGAADTFRAAAADQLQTWGDRVDVPVVRGKEGADPASVAFLAVERGLDRPADVVVVDTAGRLHTKVGLMDELGKIKRVIEKLAPVTEVLLVIDATTGQNGLTQARVFAEVVDVTGIVLSKLDGSAKGGIVVQVQRELKVPVKLVGLGEGPDDLAVFDAESFVDALLDEG
jgi:fused signal recognition particle receptor